MKRFDGKVAILTGGASGIGAALAKELVRRGAEVVLADMQAAASEELAANLRRGGGKATASALDVRDLASMQRLVDTTASRAGRIDLFFNNAGIGVGGEMDTYAPRDWDDVFDVNLRGVANGIQAIYPIMIRQHDGHIINTASMAGLVAAPADGSYTAAKHAVVGLSKALRLEAERHGVRVSVLCPGAVDTPILTGGKYGRVNVEGLRQSDLRAMWDLTRPMNADAFARRAVDAIAKNEAIIVLPSWWKALWYLDRLSPPISAAVWRRMLKHLRAEIERRGGRPTKAHHAPPAAISITREPS
jgi:NAD(P)-dependent dehydrogenase (short-subunit alcohol dehydrogenase family)